MGKFDSDIVYYEKRILDQEEIIRDHESGLHLQTGDEGTAYLARLRGDIPRLNDFLLALRKKNHV